MVENPVTGGPAEMPSSKPLDNARAIPLSLIDFPTLNSRRDFGDMVGLAGSMAAVGLLEPIIVRPRAKGRVELVAGERRLRSAHSLGWKCIDASVRELTDKEAAEIRLLENRDRASLNPIEESHAFRALIDLGHTPASLGKLIREAETVVNERLNLLTLPDAWQTRVRKGELSGAAAEYLVPYADRPRVLDAMVRHLEAMPMPLSEWKKRIVDAVMVLSRSLDPRDPAGPRFDVEQNLSRLDVVTLDVGRVTVRRAMNAGIWDDLQDRVDGQGAAELPPAAASPSAAPHAESNGSRNGKSGGDRQSRRAATSAPRYGEPVLNDADEAEEDFRLKLAEYKAAWYRRVLTERIAAMPLAKLLDVASQYGPLFVDIDAEWKLRRDFLSLYKDGRLDELAAELSVDVTGCDGDREKAAVLLHASPGQVPRDFRYAADPNPPATTRTA
jgi:ParB/RepB/Spo0J family partition protein